MAIWFVYIIIFYLEVVVANIDVNNGARWVDNMWDVDYNVLDLDMQVIDNRSFLILTINPQQIGTNVKYYPNN